MLNNKGMKNPKEKILSEIMESFVRVVNKFNRFEKVPMDFGVDEKLFPSEIHTIEAIGNHQGANVTELSDLLGITKGAVSQMILKLSHKLLVKKVKNPNNEKEIYLELTEKGQQAFKGHEKFHRDMYMDFLRYMGNFTTKDFRNFNAMLTKIEQHLDLYKGKLLS